MSLDAEAFREWMATLAWLGGALWVWMNVAGRLKGVREVPSQYCRSKFEQLEKAASEARADGLERIAATDAHYDSRVRGLKNSVDRGMDALRAELKEMRGELRADILRIEERSSAGDAGLRELSKDLVNAVGTIKDLMKERGADG